MRLHQVRIPAGDKDVIPTVGNYIRVSSALVPVRFVVQETNSEFYLEAGDDADVLEFKKITVHNDSGVDQDFTFYTALNEKIGSTKLGGSINIGNTVSTQQNSAPANTAKTVTSSSSTLISSNAARKSLIVQNKNSIGRVWINHGVTAATQSNGLLLEPGEEYSPLVVPTGSMTAIGDLASNSNVVVIEG